MNGLGISLAEYTAKSANTAEPAILILASLAIELSDNKYIEGTNTTCIWFVMELQLQQRKYKYIQIGDTNA